MTLPSFSTLLIYSTSAMLLVCIVIIISVYIYKIKSYKSYLQLAQAMNEEKERTMQFVSMEVHDNFTQMLCMTRMALYIINDHAVPENKHEIDAATQFVDKMITASHNLIHSLYPEELYANGLIYSIEEEINWINKINETKIQFQHNGTPFDIDKNETLMTFRILQEALSNVIKHSRATKIEVTINCNDSLFIMNISDNGVGFNLQNKLQSPVGNGLKNIFNRAEICGGLLTIESIINQGTNLELTIENRKSG